MSRPMTDTCPAYSTVHSFRGQHNPFSMAGLSGTLSFLRSGLDEALIVFFYFFFVYILFFLAYAYIFYSFLVASSDRYDLYLRGGAFVS